MTTITATATRMPRINLMPKSEIARRERDKLLRKWVWAVVAAILVALLLVGASFYVKWLADQRLLAEQARTNELITEIASLSEVSQALATRTELTAFRTEAMASDLAWTPVLEKIVGTLPADTTVTGFNLQVGGVPQTEDPASEVGLVGTLTFDSATPLDIVPIIRSLRAVEGVLFADGRSLTGDTTTGRFVYQLDVQFDQTVYSGEFVAEEGEN